MNTLLAVRLAASMFIPCASDTPPTPPPLAALLRMNSMADVVANTRLADGRRAPAQLQPPGMLNQPEMVTFLRTNYPDTLRPTGAPHVGFIWMFVDPSGRLGRHRVIKSTGAAQFDSLGVRAVRILAFSPAHIEGRRVGVWIPFPVHIGAYDALRALRLPLPPDQDYEGRGPVFTPYSVKPEVVNRDEIARALVRNYPPQLRDKGIGGTTLVWMLIARTGETRQVQIKSSSGYPELDAAAIKVASVIRFSPAKNGSTPVAVWIALPIVFKPNK